MKIKRTLKSYLLSVLDRESFTSPGYLFRDSQMIGYDGEQEKLLRAADRLSDKGVLESRAKGTEQIKWYRLAV